MGSEKNPVTVLIYRHRHGEDVTVYATPHAARQGALRIIADNLHELATLEARQSISKALAAEDPPDDIIELWQDAQDDLERIEISDDVIVITEEETERALCPMCPKCTTTDPKDIQIRETYSAYHPVSGMLKGKLCVENALATSCPSEHFDDGQSDYVAYCTGCHHEGPPASFGLGDSSDWEWV